jgi:hypothetical protein
MAARGLKNASGDDANTQKTKMPALFITVITIY